MPCRVVLAEDHTLIRTLLCDRLDSYADLEVVGAASNGLEAVALCGQQLPDVALLDLTMPEMDGLAAIPLIREVSPDTRCMVLTMHTSQTTLREVLQAGAVGYLVKTVTERTIVDAIRRVAAGHSVIDLPMTPFDDLSQVVSHPPPRPGAPEGDGEPVLLTTHERELLRLVGLGLTNKEMGAALHLSPKTIEVHRAKLMRKLGVRRRSELVAYALRLGVLRPMEPA